MSMINVRRSELDDIASINEIVAGDSHQLRKIYGKTNIVNLIENSYLSITAVDDAGNIIGFAAMSDSTPHGWVLEKWLEWFYDTYRTTESTV
jgi:hypothetical protein